MDASGISSSPKPLPQPTIIRDGEPITKAMDRFSANLEVDILGKYLWAIKELAPSPEAIRSLHQRNIRRIAKGKTPVTHVTDYMKVTDASNCVLNQIAILSSFFGQNYHASLKYLNAEDPLRGIAELREKFLSKEATVSTGYRIQNAFRGNFGVASVPLDENHWTIYAIKIHKGDVFSGEAIHAFAILQAAENGKVIYKILQSYVGQYYFNQYDATYTTGEMLTFLEELSEVYTSYTWNEKNNHLFSHFFKSNERIREGKTIKFERRLTIQVGEATRAAFEHISREYQRDFPANYRIKISKQ